MLYNLIQCGIDLFLTVVQEVCDVQLSGGDDVRKHFILVSKSWHLNHQTWRHLRDKCSAGVRWLWRSKIGLLCQEQHSPLQTWGHLTSRMCQAAVGQWAPVPSALFLEKFGECRHPEMFLLSTWKLKTFQWLNRKLGRYLTLGGLGL